MIIINVGLIVLISKILGFMRDISLSYFFGVSRITDAYIIALTIPTVIFNLIGLGLKSCFIPLYTEIENKENSKIAQNFMSNFMNCQFILIFLILILIYIFPDNIVKIFAPGFTDTTLQLASLYTRISSLSIFFVIIMNTFSDFLQIHGKFYIVALIGIPLNIVYILGNFIAYKKGAVYLPILSVIAVLIPVLILGYFVYRLNYKYNCIVNFKDQYIRRIMILAAPVILSGAMEEINYLIDKIIASMIYPNGGITVLNYSNKLNISLIGIFISSAIGVIFPRISSLVAHENYNGLKIEVYKLLKYTIIFAVPLNIQLIIFSNPIIEFLFKRGKFSIDDVLVTSICLKFYTLSFLAIALRQIALQVFYATKNTKIPLLNSIFGTILNIILNLILSNYLGLIGIPLATSISSIFVTVGLFYYLNKFDFFCFSDLIVPIVKIFISSICLVVSIYSVFKCLKRYDSIFFMFISASIGILIYMIMLILLKINLKDKKIEVTKEKFNNNIQNENLKQ